MNEATARNAGRVAIARAIFGIVGLGAAGLLAARGVDPVVFSFSTVGDSRTDPNKPDQTTLLANPSPTTQGGVPSLTGTILPQDNEWVQNTQALATILANIQSQGPNLLFFNGDMVFGYGRPVIPSVWQSDGALPNTWKTPLTAANVGAGSLAVTPDFVFELQQYAYWRGIIAPMFLAGTYVLPVPGNHETQCSYSAAPYTSATGASNPNCDTTAVGNKTGKTAYPENENMFRMNMGDLVNDLSANIRFSNVSGYFAQNVSGLTQPTAPTASTFNGQISTSQADLSYSFDITPVAGVTLHFAVINTDPSGADSTAPADWLANDLGVAKSHGASKFFVFGHKAAYTYGYTPGGSVLPPNTNPGPGGLDANFVTTTKGNTTTYSWPLRDAFWKVIAQYNATYFSGHEHTVNVARYTDPTGTYSNNPFQVIVGSGGSPFDDKLKGTCTTTPGSCTEPALNSPYDRYYAWATVSIHQSGRVTMQVSGFNDQFGPVQDLSSYSVPGASFPGVTTLQ